MVWSFSGSRQFKQCQRAWHFKHHFADARATKNPKRREAYLLSTLQSIPAWRGSVVDLVITEQLIPLLNRRGTLSANALINHARHIFDQQLAFALNQEMWQPGMSKVKAGNAFAALLAVEYGTEITQVELDQAWSDIEASLINLSRMTPFIERLQMGIHWLAQRPIFFTFQDVSIRVVPDLIVLYRNQPPLIIDWKVHTFGTLDYRLQLTAYAYGLMNCNPHRDFPPQLSRFTTTDVQLLEVQLLLNQQRGYALSENDVETLESYIVRSHLDMQLASDGQPKDLTPFDFPAAQEPDTCERCPFRALCWEESA